DHTFNPVPFLLLSPNADQLASRCEEVRDLTDISPFILDYFGVPAALGGEPGADLREPGPASETTRQQGPGPAQDQTPADTV
ncbi:MAG: hypothetical protein SVR04_07030, partial [Spirochaetota bacterium]|nr:hypothetical protein [Spirochaetota bacterium]